MSKEEEKLNEFVGITGASLEQAQFFLDASNHDVEVAVSSFYENPDHYAAETAEEQEETQTDSPMTDPEEQQPVRNSNPVSRSSTPASGSGRPTGQSASGPRVTSFRDLMSRQDDDDDDDRQNFYTGGEKSGMAVQDPTNRDRNKLVDDILKKAEKGGQGNFDDDDLSDEEAPAQRSFFTGTGYKLGGDDVESEVIPDPHAAPAQPARREKVTRTLTFWKEGFSVDDGPLYRYDDPANQGILSAINSGRAPLSVLNVEFDQPVEVTVQRKMDESYQPPKKKFKPFEGSGNRLGSPAPVVAPTPARSTQAPSRGSTPASNFQIDTSAPHGTVQIRLADGTRLVTKFNHTHTVGDIYSFIDASRPGETGRSFVLQTTFPNRELTDKSQTVKEAGLVGAVVTQKYV
ncbi:SEP-domain-containing protein [Saitoella complicata NRRL Y-17804]|nr:SEP-domain-containing protein [Saitoella complicata NRRL Y-17804]ODQ51649.1 SEP-domain-containing protein [Saitoella complicata NRRL Y-17804]